MFSIFPIIIMSTVFKSSFIMTMRNFPPFANLYYQYSFLQIFLRILFVLMVQSFFNVTWGATNSSFFFTLISYSSSGLWWTLKTYGNSRVTVNLESILRISGSQLTLKTYKEFQDHN